MAGRSEVRLLLCDGRNRPIALEFGGTVINRHRPWACPKRAPHFQVGAGDHQLAESLHGRRGKELSEKSGCWVPGGPASAPPNCTEDTSGVGRAAETAGRAWSSALGDASAWGSVSRPHPGTRGPQGTSAG